MVGLDVAIRRMEAAEDRHEARYRAKVNAPWQTIPTP